MTDLTDQPDPEADADRLWGLARMADARLASGAALTAEDDHALEVYPAPPSSIHPRPEPSPGFHPDGTTKEKP